MAAESRCYGKRSMKAIFAGALVLCVMAGCRKQEAGQQSQEQAPSVVAEQPVEPQPPVAEQEVQLPPDAVKEILGRWKIKRYDMCGISGMGDEEADWHIGKTVLIEPRRAIFKERSGEEVICHYTGLYSVFATNLEDQLAQYYQCPPNFGGFTKLKEKETRIFEFTPSCGVTPFGVLFKIDGKTLVIRWEGIYFFMERDTNTATGMELGGHQGPAPAGVVKR